MKPENLINEMLFLQNVTHHYVQAKFNNIN